MTDIELREWVFDAAQTNLTLKGTAGADLVPAGMRMAVTFCKVAVGGSVTADVSARVGFGASGGSLPTITNNSANGIPEIVLSHSGIKPGGGEVNANGGEPFCVGGIAEQPIVTVSVPTAGQVRILLGFSLVNG